MSAAADRTARRIVARLTPLLIAAAALPLLAPTCGTFEPGVKSFSRNSLIIPMDVCYQCSLDDANAQTTTPSACGTTYVAPTGNGLSGTSSCPQATDAGDVIKAYGLVYQLIRAGVPVYWTIKSNKATLDAEDLRISYSGGPAAYLYDWASPTGGMAGSVTSQPNVGYRGGPFVVDGSDFVKASQVLQQYKATFQNVNVHVANVAFQAEVARTMAGGWSAGGDIPPKLALLDVGSTGGGTTKNSEVVIRGYLVKAGLDFTNAGGTSADGAHGQIYDRLVMSDFLPSTPGDWKTTRLYLNGYQILWVPHWFAAGSCSNVSSCSSTQYSDANVAAALQTIGSFVTDAALVGGKPAGLKDLFAECAGLGSFDGVVGNTAYSPSGAISDAQSASTRFQSTTGMEINGIGGDQNTSMGGTQLAPAKYDNPAASYSLPLLQIGDFPFVPLTGAIDDFKPDVAYKSADTTVTPEIARLIAGSVTTNPPSSSPGDYTIWDYFTYRAAHTTHGTIVYLAGHSYSGSDCSGCFQTAGTRLVLNTLFNLGAKCVASGAACSTGLLGICGQGLQACEDDKTICRQVNLPADEVCNGLDDDCNGLIDDLPVQYCFDDDPALKNVGQCREGVRSCVKRSDGSYGFSDCVGQQLPTSEICNGLDDDCDGAYDEDPANPALELSHSCYLGPSSSIDPATGLPMGACKTGTQSCSSGTWSPCVGQVTPVPEYCGPDAGSTGNGIDENCNGEIDEGCICTDTTPAQTCYGGPAGTASERPCKSGLQTCSGGAWSACRVCTPAEAAMTTPPADCQILPSPEICGNGIDDDCNTLTDDASICNVCPAVHQSCYEGPEATLDPVTLEPRGECQPGERICTLGTFGACGGWGGVDGKEWFKTQILDSDEVCDGKDNDCDGVADEGPPACADGTNGTHYQCVNGYCVPEFCNPTEPDLSYMEGYKCVVVDPAYPEVGHYVVDRCGDSLTGPYCLAGDQCSGGTCIDPCEQLNCGGTSCGGGQCTGGSCYAEGCTGGLICKNGNCVENPCKDRYCPSGTFCREGDCVQACTFVSCGTGQRCGEDGFCVADPCQGVTCSSGQTCVDGRCDPDPCVGVTCGTGQLCKGGSCVDDFCATISCPVGACWRGQCFSSANPFGDGAIPAPEEEKKADGCGCGSGSPSPFALLLGLLALPLARRRRDARAGGALALLLAAGLTATLAGCPKEEEPKVDPGPTVIDVMTDANNCGQLGNVCDPGQICVDGSCGSLVAPWIAALSPSQTAKGTAPLLVTVSGARFASGAKLRVTTPFGENLVPTTFVDAQQVTAMIDVSSAPSGQVYVRVLNATSTPGTMVRSNAVAFAITLDSPHLDDITPATALAGSTVTVTVTGTGLNATSQCHLKGPTFADRGLPSELSGAALLCTLDASTVPPGSDYVVYVRNEGPIDSNTRAFSVVSDTSVRIDSISPSSAVGGTGSIVSNFFVFGAGFDEYSLVYFASAVQSTTYIDPFTLYVAQLDLTGYDDADYPITVHNGATISLPKPFTISASAPNLLSVTPQTVLQGDDPKTIIFTGTGLGSTSVIQLRKPDGALAADVAYSSRTATQVQAIVDPKPVASWPEGEWQIWLKFLDGSTSATFPFRLLSSTPTLTKVTPAAGTQGVSTGTLTVEGVNFLSGINVRLINPSGAEVLPRPTTTRDGALPTKKLTVSSIPLVGFETGLYQLVAYNEGGGASNALSFSVMPGVPTITSLSPTFAVQTNTPTTVTINGTNFAKADDLGNGGSQVVVWNTGCILKVPAPVQPPPPEPPISIYLDIPTQVLPSSAVTVSSTTSISVSFDTLNAIASDTCPYTVQIWNPGGMDPPQESPDTSASRFTVRLAP